MKMPSGLAMILAASVALSGCSDSATSDQAQAAPAPIAPTEQEAPRFDIGKIEAAKEMLSEEPKIGMVIYEPMNAIEWIVAVNDDGSKRYGFAGYVCLRLREWGLYDDNVDVRVVDIAKMPEYQDAYRDYSLGAVRCKDEAHLD